MYAQVIVDIAHSNVDKLFTYMVPEDMELGVGRRVMVPFGAGNKAVEGFVLALMETFDQSGVQIKRISRGLEPYNVLSGEQISLAYWIKSSYHCLLVDALRLMIPAQLRGGRVKEKTIRTVKVSEGVDGVAILQSMMKKDGTPRSPRQYEVLELLLNSGVPMSVPDITQFIPGAACAIKALLEKGYLCEEDREVYRKPFGSKKIKRSEPLLLTTTQQLACDAICEGLHKREGAFLLHGVTGSGKTEVYMQAIAKAVEDGGAAIVLVPEISLTPQAVDRFRSRFGDRVAVLHSHLSAGERYDEWRRILMGKVDVVVGARSAVFAPLKNIRLIVVDEEHEPSYQSGIMPRYSAVEVAEKRCKLNGAVLVLGSATPSIASYMRAKRGRYTLLAIEERVQDLPMPEVVVADMRRELAAGNKSIFSAELYGRLKVCFETGKQAILFVNRRGYSTFISCRGCGYVIECDNCDVSMTYHKIDGLMKCHYCGAVKKIPEVCPVCKKPYLKSFGVGTQQVEEQFKAHFPGVDTLRMDTDTTRGKNSHDELLSTFARGEAQVLIGTQMVAKGLDMPNVTVVGVIAADSSLYIPDYRSNERTFQLLTQVAGRAGRAAGNGHVVIQTYSPDHPVIALAAKHDYRTFYERESAARRNAMFPPYAIFLRILFADAEEQKAREAAEKFTAGLRACILETLRRSCADERELLFLSCSPAPVKRKEGQYRYQVLIKLARTKTAGGVIGEIYRYADDHRSNSFAALEVNPGDMF